MLCIICCYFYYFVSYDLWSMPCIFADKCEVFLVFFGSYCYLSVDIYIFKKNMRAWMYNQMRVECFFLGYAQDFCSEGCIEKY